MSTMVERPEDMSIVGKLRLLIQSDGDVIVAIRHKDLMIDIEFCAPVSGGGRSPETWKALHALAVAMRADNANQSDTNTEREA
jgi:hypothetical protein